MRQSEPSTYRRLWPQAAVSTDWDGAGRGERVAVEHEKT